MSQYQAMANSVHPLLGFACCSKCQGLRVDGKAYAIFSAPIGATA